MDRSDLQLKKPSIRSASKSLFMQAPKALMDATMPNLCRPLRELIADGEELTVTDQSLPFSLQVRVNFESQ
jgi:ubiquitin-activating enzyme E1 C